VLLRLTLALSLPLNAGAKPNIVFIIADDLGWNDVGYHGSEIKTPNIDALASRGMELDRYYAYPSCSPTRTAIMTGRTPIRQGVELAISTGGLPLDEHLLPQTLKAAGYQTFQTGKWHLGLMRVAWHPYARGFDHSYGHLGGEIDYFTHIYYGGLDWQRNGKVVREEGYSTELITRESVKLIKQRDKSKPMFLYVAFNAPHLPLQVTDKYLDRYAGGVISNKNRKFIAAMISAVDDGVGEILDAVESEGIVDDTLVVWVSDNGGLTQAGASNTPLRAGKGTAFEGGIRVPGIIQWPGVLASGEKFEQRITAHDWFPTLAAAAGVEPKNTKPFDGIDMWPALKDGKQVDHDEIVIGIKGNYMIIRDGWKLVEYTPRTDPANSEMYLFRIDEDPNEENNLIDTEPELAKELFGRIRAIPKPPSVAGRRGRQGGRSPGVRDLYAGSPEETRPPWLEVAIRD